MMVLGEEGRGRIRFLHFHYIEPHTDLPVQTILTAFLHIITQRLIRKCR